MDPFKEVVSRPDGNDSRMQQVTYAAGMLWGALDTAINPDDGPSRAGIAWYIIDPHAATVRRQGYLGGPPARRWPLRVDVSYRRQGDFLNRLRQRQG